MNKSSSEILREYAKIIIEASQDDATGFSDDGSYDANQDELAIDDKQIHDEDNGIDLPDESMMDEPEDKEDNEFKTYDQMPENDPVINLSRELHVDSDAISKWLKANNYELTPVNGLSNKSGNV